MAVVDAHVFPGCLTAVLIQISFQSHRLLYSHPSVEVRGEITPERNFASTGSQTLNHQVMSPTRSSLSHPDGATVTSIFSFPCKRHLLTLSQTSPGVTYLRYKSFVNTEGKGEIARNEQFLLFQLCFLSFRRPFSHIKFKIVVCKLFQFGRV